MEISRWQKVEEIFNEAVLLPPEQRHGFLNRVCGDDPELSDEILTLLKQSDEDENFLSQPAFDLGAQLLDTELSDILEQEFLGSYQLQRMIGRGGTGVVFLAEDLRLERLVALKILPPAVAENDERLMRLQQEAKAVSAISHANVAHIYEFGESKGYHYLAMEYVPGQTLRQLLKENKIDLLRALSIALQVCKALAAAHEIGILHRDIKPENIIIRDDESVKVLDFGLAKLYNPQKPTGKLKSPSLSFKTTPGLIIGTTAYMSPEQVRGQELDQTTDLWSLGVLFYEMVNGTRPFLGETSSDVQAAVLLVEPPPLHLADELPCLEQIIRQTLTKDAAQRIHTANELIAELKTAQRRVYDFVRANNLDGREQTAPAFEEIITSASAGETTGSSGETTARQNERAQSSGFNRNLILLGGLAILLFTTFYLFARQTIWQSKKPLTISQTTRITNSGRAVQISLSSNGDLSVYALEEAGKQALYLRRSDAGSPLMLIPPAAVEYVGAAFCPDNSRVYYAWKHADEVTASLYQIPAAGGEPQKILTDIDSAPSFSPDGSQIIFLRLSSDNSHEDLIVANADGSNERLFLRRQMPEFLSTYSQPSWSPDGKSIACAVGVFKNGDKKMQIVSIRLSDKSITALTKQEWAEINQVAWQNSKTLLMIARQNQSQDLKQIWRVNAASGEAVPLTNDFNSYTGLSPTADGTAVAAIAANRKADLWCIGVGSDEHTQMTFDDNAGYGVSWTSDNRLVYSSTASGNPDIWIVNKDKTNRRQLTSDENSDTEPVISPDNRFIVFTSTRTGSRQIWRMDIDGNNQIQLTSGSIGGWNPVVTPDGKYVFYYAFNVGGDSLCRVSINGGAVEIIARGVRRYPAVSPDGKWLLTAYRPDGTTVNKFGIVPLDDPKITPRVFEPTAGARSPGIMRWTRDSRAFTYIVNKNGVQNIWKQSLDNSPPKQITSFTEGNIYAFDWSPNGRHIIIARGNSTANAVLMRLAE